MLPEALIIFLFFFFYLVGNYLVYNLEYLSEDSNVCDSNHDLSF